MDTKNKSRQPAPLKLFHLMLALRKTLVENEKKTFKQQLSPSLTIFEKIEVYKNWTIIVSSGSFIVKKNESQKRLTTEQQSIVDVIGQRLWFQNKQTKSPLLGFLYKPFSCYASGESSNFCPSFRIKVEFPWYIGPLLSFYFLIYVIYVIYPTDSAGFFVHF